MNLLKDSFICLLKSTGFVHLEVTVSAFRMCYTLAAALQCPLVASTAEYYALCGSCDSIHPPHYTFLPLPLIQWKAVGISSSACPTSSSVADAVVHQSGSERRDADSRYSCSFLTAHRFVIERSCLGDVAELNRRIILHFLGSKVVPRLRLPVRVEKLIHEGSPFNSGDHVRLRRWRALTSWLKEFPPGSVEPINEILKRYKTAEERSHILDQLVSGLVWFLPAPTEMKWLISDLHSFENGSQIALRLLESDLIKRGSNHNKNDDYDDDDAEGESNLFGCKEQTSSKFTLRFLIKCEQVHNLVKAEFTRGWPSSLKQAYRQCCFASYLLGALYKAGGVAMPFFNSWSPYDAALPIRLLFYRVMVGLEQRLGHTDKLKGLRSDGVLVEYVVKGDLLHRSELTIDPISFDAAMADSCDGVVCAHLNLNATPDEGDATWVFAFACVLALCHRHAVTSDRVGSVKQSTITLAVAACAAANVVNCEADEQGLSSYYDNDAGFACRESDDNTCAMQSRESFMIEMIAMQLIYQCLSTLVTMLNGILSAISSSGCSKLFTFLPPWKLFPSTRLVTRVASHLLSQHPDRRLHTVARYWLPRLLRTDRTKSVESAHRLKHLICVFDRLISMACVMGEEHGTPAAAAMVKTEVNCFTGRASDDSERFSTGSSQAGSATQPTSINSDTVSPKNTTQPNPILINRDLTDGKSGVEQNWNSACGSVGSWQSPTESEHQSRPFRAAATSRHSFAASSRQWCHPKSFTAPIRVRKTTGYAAKLLSRLEAADGNRENGT